MRFDLSIQPIQLRSLMISAVCSTTIIAATLFAPQYIRSQQDQKAKQEETKKPPQKKKTEVSRRPAPKRKKGLFESRKVTVVVGANIRAIDGDRPGKFQETRDFPKGPTIRAIHLNFNSPDTPYILDFKGLELGERDRRVTAEAESVGKFKTRFLWDQIPHYFSSGLTFHTSAEPGVLTVDPALRARLQAVPNSSAAGSLVGPALPAAVSQELQNTRSVQLRIRSDQLLFTQSYHPNENWEFYFRAQNIRRNGTRPKPTGTFANETNGPAGDLVWEALGVELAEPVSYRTTNLSFGIHYSQPKWRVGVQYNLSMFRNSISSLTWENPFRATDALATAPSFNVGRNRFVRAQLALPPDNDFQSISFFGSADLPHNTQLRGAISWGRGTQNEQFLPYTLNSAMVAANLLPGQPALFNLAPPQPSLNGVINTLNQDYTLASRPWKSMRFMLQYRFNDRDNKTPVIVFPGLSAFGDSGVRTSVDFYNTPIENFPFSYTTQNATASWEWSLRKNINLELEYDLEIWNRTYREAPRTNEHSIQGRVDYKLSPGVALKLDYLYAHRKPTIYRTQPLVFDPTLNGPLGSWVVTPGTQFNPGLREEFNLLRQFDESDRIRKEGGASLEVTRWENLSFSASYRYLRHDYDKRFYGLQYDEVSTVDAEVSYFPMGASQDDSPAASGGWLDNSFFYANYSREFSQTGYLGLGHRTVGAARNVTACCAQFPIANTFDRSSRINFDMFQFGFNTASKGERTVLNFSYGLGFANDRTTTVNPFPILAVSPRTAGAYDYPDVINRQQEINMSLTHQLRSDLAVGVIYRYEPYRLDDYYTNNLQPYSPRQPAATVASALTPRYLFLDARFTTYHANVATIFIRYSF
ncbi:MAG: MtrB/PioB family outer membrane beta-barrel protein [Acidobacteria bacterium]|nr:MtrB/PioB family outer membrane beta-barrel protein [Acidobacteriota bacterium]